MVCQPLDDPPACTVAGPDTRGDQSGDARQAWRPAGDARRRAVLAEQVERIVVDAKRMGLELSDVLAAIRKAWT